MASLLSKFVVALLLFSSPVANIVKAAKIHPRQISNFPGGAPFWGYDGCSAENIRDIEQAWADVLTLSNGPRNFYPAGVIEKRIFGDDIESRFEVIALIESPRYEESTIVLCGPFFYAGLEHLGQIVSELRGGTKEDQTDSTKMIGKAKILLYELTHLPAIEGVSDGNTDTYAWYASLKYFEGMFGTPRAVRMGRDISDEPEDNDGSPEPPSPEPAGPSKALNIILENKRRGVPGDENFEDRMNWRFYSVNFGTASQCQKDPGPTAEAPADVPIASLSMDIVSIRMMVKEIRVLCGVVNMGLAAESIRIGRGYVAVMALKMGH
ncbi:hypothetical protein IL306_004497 [Fusarium sp. DS 682]|nr:hypothetical protein IL306_004497 [Fusarium sp. DS 682]